MTCRMQACDSPWGPSTVTRGHVRWQEGPHTMACMPQYMGAMAVTITYSKLVVNAIVLTPIIMNLRDFQFQMQPNNINLFRE